MRLSEILLRLGCHLVGWLIIYSHCIWLGVIPIIACGPEGEELFLLSLVFSPIVIGATLLLAPASKLPGVVIYLKWLASPLLLLIPLASMPVLEVLQTTTFGGAGLCGLTAAAGWQRIWAPLQLATLVAIVVAAVRFVAKPGAGAD